MVANDDVETQQKGCISIFYAVDAPYVRYEFKFVYTILQLLDALPIRIEAMHFCHNSLWTWAPKIATFRLASTIQRSLRTQIHYGT